MSGVIVFPKPERPELEVAAQRQKWRDAKRRQRKRIRDRKRQGF